jgi:hypothetical protein
MTWSRRVGVHGTGRDHPPMERAPTWDFRSVEGLVRWFLNEGREAMRGEKAIDYSKGTGRRKAGERDFWKLEATHERFGFASKAMQGLTKYEEMILIMAYRGVEDAKPREAVEDRKAGQSNLLPPLADWQIAERVGKARRTVTDDRRRALRRVRENAERLGLLDEAA